MNQSDLLSICRTPDLLSDAFKEAFRCHPSGVAIITADPGDRPVALTVSSLISVSAAPPIVAFSLSSKSSASQAVLDAESVVIHLLRFGNLDLAKLGATSGANRFGPDVEWERLPSGEPRYSTVGTWFRAKIVNTLPTDGAIIVAAELLEGQAAPVDDVPEADTLIYFDRRWHRLREVHDGANR
ncbi:flavin reductase family protein [Paraburkholderia sp. BCC1886]|uniref:flavin reductase family protein n=1 Tax=Paraburkholderia sp. BCC1886 TaxID=2562670 RepID=UPI0011823771|nr:flavin reductase family protein [Paraburkholderia sp. BCC1886]